MAGNDTAHHLHPLLIISRLKEGSIIITKADGVHLTTSDDKQLLDAMSLWCVNVVMEERILQMLPISKCKNYLIIILFKETATPPSIELAKDS